MKKSKLKRNLIIIFSIIAIIAVTIFVLYNVTDIFRTKRGAFFRYLGQIENIKDILENSEEYENYKKTKESMPYTINGEMSIAKSENIADDYILNKIRLTSEGKVDPQSERVNTNISIKSNNNELFNAKLVRDKKIYTFYSPQIADGYIAVRNDNVTELAKNIGLSNAEDFPEQIMPIDIDKILDTSSVEKKSIEKYIKMVRNKAPDTSYSKDLKTKIEIEGQKYNTNSYTLKLTPEQNSNLQIEILEELTKDSIMMNYITSKCKLMNFTGDCTDINLLNNMLKKRIETLKKNPKKAGDLTVTLYEYRQKNIQTKIVIGNKTIKITHLDNQETEFVKLEIEENNEIKTLKIEKEDNKSIIKLQKSEGEILKSIEFIYNMTGKVADNNIQNNLTINLVNDIKSISFEYKENISFTNDIGSFENMQEARMLVVNDYEANYIREFIELLKKQINSVYINQASRVGINLDPIFR